MPMKKITKHSFQYKVQFFQKRMTSFRTHPVILKAYLKRKKRQLQRNARVHLWPLVSPLTPRFTPDPSFHTLTPRFTPWLHCRR